MSTTKMILEFFVVKDIKPFLELFRPERPLTVLFYKNLGVMLPLLEKVSGADILQFFNIKINDVTATE